MDVDRLAVICARFVKIKSLSDVFVNAAISPGLTARRVFLAQGVRSSSRCDAHADFNYPRLKTIQPLRSH